MKWIGLTGGIATGKSTVSQMLTGRGYAVADADQIARDVVNAGTLGLKKIVDRFGVQILNEDKTLNRRALGKLVFGRPRELEDLENILHPLIQNETLRLKQKWQAAGEAVAFYDVPLLFEKNLQLQFDQVVLITCSLENQKNRMRNRDQLADKEIQNRLSSQLDLKEKERRADRVIWNDGSLQDLELQVQHLISEIQSGKAMRS